MVRDGALVGMIDRETLLAARGTPNAAKVVDLFGANAPNLAMPDETCRSISNRLAVQDLERLPVVADAQSRRLVGIVSRSDLVKPSLAFFHEEERREMFRRTPLQALKQRFMTKKSQNDTRREPE